MAFGTSAVVYWNMTSNDINSHYDIMTWCFKVCMGKKQCSFYVTCCKTGCDGMMKRFEGRFSLLTSPSDHVMSASGVGLGRHRWHSPLSHVTDWQQLIRDKVHPSLLCWPQGLFLFFSIEIYIFLAFVLLLCPLMASWSTAGGSSSREVPSNFETTHLSRAVQEKSISL